MSQRISGSSKWGECVLRTLAITWPQGVLSEEDSLAVAAQVNGGVS